MTDQRMFSWREHVQSARLPSTTKLVLLTLSTHMTRMGESCFPTTRQISWECSLSRVSVMKHLGDAEKLGWIVRSAHGFAGQRWKNHEYKPAIPKDAKIVLWHESEDGIQAEKELKNCASNIDKAGQSPLPPCEKAGQGGLPPLGEAGQPHDERWSTSREKVVKEVDLRSSLAHQVGVHNDINVRGNRAETTDYLKILCEKFGYLKHRIHNAHNIEKLKVWVENQYTISEITTAVMISIEGTKKDQPPIGYVTEVLASNRQVKAKRSIRPEERPDYEAPEDRAQRMAAEDAATDAQRQEVVNAN